MDPVSFDVPSDRMNEAELTTAGGAQQSGTYLPEGLHRTFISLNKV